jgi:hypothetical protein
MLESRTQTYLIKKKIEQHERIRMQNTIYISISLLKYKRDKCIQKKTKANLQNTVVFFRETHHQQPDFSTQSQCFKYRYGSKINFYRFHWKSWKSVKNWSKFEFQTFGLRKQVSTDISVDIIGIFIPKSIDRYKFKFLKKYWKIRKILKKLEKIINVLVNNFFQIRIIYLVKIQFSSNITWIGGDTNITWCSLSQQ